MTETSVSPSAFSFDQLAQITEHMGRTTFGPQYFHLMKEALHIQQCAIFAFEGDGPPRAVVLETSSTDKRFINFSLDYVKTNYREDANYQRLQGGGQGEPAAVSHQDVLDLADVEVQKIFLSQNIRYELILFGFTDKWKLYICLHRTPKKQPFTEKEIAFLKASGPYQVQVLSKHLDLLTKSNLVSFPHSNAPGSYAFRLEALLEHFRSVLKRDDLLTPREVEICAHIIIGYSSTAIGTLLGISALTVTTHRKKIYKKLGIGSQNELFLRYFEKTLILSSAV